MRLKGALLAACGVLLAVAHPSHSLPQLADLPTKAYGIPVLVQNSGDLETTIIEYLGLQPGTTLHRRATMASIRQTKLTRFDQRIFGRPVYASVVTVESDADESSVYKIYRYPESSYTVLPSALLDAQASEDDALKATASAFKIRRALLKQYAKDEDAHLVWYLDGDNHYRLSYQASFYFAAPWMKQPMRPHAIVDAKSGQVLSSWNAISYAATTFTGIGGNIGAWGRVTYRGLPATLIAANNCSLKTADWEVHHVRNVATNVSTRAWSFACNAANSTTYDNTNGAYSPLNDVAYAMNVGVAMFNSYLSEYPLDRSVNPSFVLVALVHYGVNFVNAFWNGAQLVVGDGDSNYYPFSALDVVTHEIGHAFTGRCSTLQTSGQSGAINEAFSDMTGTLAKYYVNNTADFLWGRLVLKNGSALRNLCTPTAIPGSIDNAANWNINTEIHKGAGVYNKAFCLLSKSANWNIVMAYQAFAWANKGYWISTLTYNVGACGVQDAAMDLFGPTLAAAVAPAFRAVGVRC